MMPTGMDRKAALFALLLMPAAVAAPPDKVLWGSLAPGPYVTGFRVSFQPDYGRNYDAAFVADTARRRARNPRPILAAVWYPALETNSARIAYRDYFRLPAGPSDFGPRLARFAQSVAAEDIFGKKPAQLTAEDRAAFDRFLALSPYAIANAEPAAGKFPVVLYHSGASGSYEDNSALCEYLASNGYVAISSAYQSFDATYPGNGYGDASKSLRDFAFLIGYAATLPFADVTRIGAVGHSAGAQAIIRWMGEPDCPADAAVILDTTVEYSGLAAHKVLKEALERSEWYPSAPMLLFATADRHPNFKTWDDYLMFAPRYEASVPALSHNEYLMHGSIRGALAPSADAARAALVRRNYDAVCVLTRNFLDLHLKGIGQARAYVLKPEAPISVRYREPSPPVPTGRQLLLLMKGTGIDGVAAAIKPMPIAAVSESMLLAGKLLLEENLRNEAIQFQALFARRFPAWPGAYVLLGAIALSSGDSAKAEAAYKKVLAISASNSKVPSSQKAAFQEEARASLAALGARRQTAKP